MSELRAVDGVPVATFNVGSQPFGVAFDGANIWVTQDGGRVSELRAKDGAILDASMQEVVQMV